MKIQTHSLFAVSSYYTYRSHAVSMEKAISTYSSSRFGTSSIQRFICRFSYEHDFRKLELERFSYVRLSFLNLELATRCLNVFFLVVLWLLSAAQLRSVSLAHDRAPCTQKNRSPDLLSVGE